MLKKENRLDKKEFDFTFKKGKKNFSKNFILIKLENQDDLKISTTVSKKNYKLAVDRNKTRRIVYKILQENFEKIPNNFWGTLIVIKPILKIDKDILKKEIFWLLNKKKNRN